MGVFGTGLYSGDFAKDLRANVAAVARLPFSTSEMLKILRDADPSAANDLVYPTCDGKNINPYYRSKELNINYTREGPIPWRQNGWGAMIIIDCGRAFYFL